MGLLSARVLAIGLLLLLGVGCAPSSDDGSGAGASGEPSAGSGGMGSGGHPSQPIPDSGVRDPMDDAGMDAAEPELPPNFTLECGANVPTDPSPEPPAAWIEERAAHGALGHEARFALRGATYRVHGETGGAPMTAPLAFLREESVITLLGFDGAEVESIEETGRVELYAERDMEGRTPASAGSIAGLPLTALSVEGGALTGALALTNERVGNTDFYHLDVAIEDLTFDAAQQVFVYPEGAERIEWMPTGPVVIRSASRLTFYQDAISVERPLSEDVELAYDGFSVAGDFESGSIDADDVEVRGTPVAVFGSGATLTVGASALESGDFRMTQAVNEAGLVIPAEVEVAPEAREIWVGSNEQRVVKLHYRERSYRGDAVLGAIEIGGAASDLLELKTGFRLALTEQIVGAVLDTGWAAPLAALASIPTVSIVFVIDLFSCFFGGCTTGPDLEPFPMWMQAGEIGTAEVLVKGDLARGTYEATLTFVGRNYCPVTVPLTIHVGEPPADAGTDAEVDGDDGSLGDAP